MKRFYKFFVIIVITVSLGYSANAQVSINTTGFVPDTSAMLDISSDSLGLLIPRMTEVQRDGISGPATGLLIYQTDIVPGFYYNSGSSIAAVWTRLDSGIEPDPTQIYNPVGDTVQVKDHRVRFVVDSDEKMTIDSIGNVGIGTTIPDTSAILDLSSSDKGLLVPRMDSVQREDIVNPATGLLIYQLDDGTGFYFNAGTPATPNWVHLASGFTTEITDVSDNTRVEVEQFPNDNHIRFTVADVERMTIDSVGNVGIGTTIPDTSAILDLSSTDKGILIPRMLKSEKDNISNPAEGLLIYQTDFTPGFYYNSGSPTAAEWTKLDSGIEPDPNQIYNSIGDTVQVDNNQIRFVVDSTERMTIDSIGNVGIGTIIPDSSAILDLSSTGKGLLVPRMDSLQREGIVGPATGLLIYQTNDVMGFYYNAGTPASPDWRSLSSRPVTQITDANGDTRVQVEKVSNEDYIRFDVAGSEKMTISNTGNVGIGTTSPDSSAILEISSTTRGFLLPRMTQSEIEEITNPVCGLQVFNKDNGSLYVFVADSNVWKEVQYAPGRIMLPGTYNIGTGGSCINNSTSGAYYENVSLDVSNIVFMDVAVSVIGSWCIKTDTINGYSFRGHGNFSATGTQQVTLFGSGVPISAQTDNFTATAASNGGICTFDVIITAGGVCGIPISYEGKNYNTILIDNQCWMAENLDIGMRINHSSNQDPTNQIIEKYCYNDIASNCDTYGGLYQWNEMMQNVTTEGTQGICPSGWHLPTDAEWTTLTTYLGGLTVAGGKLKETGLNHWETPNKDATNSSLFTGFGGGYHNASGTWYGINKYGMFWSSTDGGSSSSYYRSLDYNSGNVVRNNYHHNYGFSVRCIMDVE